MKRKVWDITVKDNPNRVVMGENDEFYTTDTEAYLVFKLDDKNFNPATAVLTLENRNDGSLKNETVDVVDGLIEWEMPQRYIEHFGNWQGQLVYEDTKDGQPELYTSAPFSFVVNAHIGDKKMPSLVEIENWRKFIRDGTELIETWEDMEDLRQANEAQRQANYQELLDTGVLQTNINNKLAEAEQEYAPRLTELEQNDENLTAQLAHNTAFNDDLGVSASSEGVVADGVSDDTLELQNLINTSGSKAIQLKTDGVYVITSSIQLLDVSKIRGNNTTVIINANVDGFIVPKNAILTGVNFRSGIVGYSKIMVRLDDKSGFTVQSKGYVENLSFRGDDALLGKGLGAYDDGERGVVTFHKGKNLHFDRLEHAFYFENTHSSSWYNGNNYVDVTMYNCAYFITMLGVCDGNVFKNIQIQPSGNAKTLITCEGRNNKFDLTVWDLDAYPNAKKYDFEGGDYNKITTNGVVTNINTNGNYSINPSNTMNSLTNNNIVVPKVSREETHVRSSSGTNIKTYRNYLGNQDDVLTMLHKIGQVEVLGKEPAGGVVENLFKVDSSSVRWDDLEPGEEVTINITLNTGNFTYLDVIGAIFTMGYPDYIHLNLVSSSGSVSNFAIPELADTAPYRDIIVGSSYRTIQIKFGVYETKTVRMVRVFASSRGMKQRMFIQTDGGDIYDDLVFDETNKGVVVKTPDGTKKYRLGVNNDGEITTTLTT